MSTENLSSPSRSFVSIIAVLILSAMGLLLTLVSPTHTDTLEGSGVPVETVSSDASGAVTENAVEASGTAPMTVPVLESTDLLEGSGDVTDQE